MCSPAACGFAVGKTELAKALADSYYGSEESMLRIDMSEYMEAHSVARLVRSPVYQSKEGIKKTLGKW